MGSPQAISNSIAASTSAFFVLGQKMPSGSRPCPRAFGPRARPAALGNFSPSDEKSLGFGAILSYIALQHPIYTLHILADLFNKKRTILP